MLQPSHENGEMPSQSSGGNRKKLQPWSLCEKWSELRKRIDASPARPPLSHRTGPGPRSKRLLTAQDVSEIVHRYEAGETSQQVGTHYDVSKTRVSTLLREQGIIIRRQGLNDDQVDEAAQLYIVGRSLAWLSIRYGVSHTTVAAALRQKAVQLRPRLRPGLR